MAKTVNYTPEMTTELVRAYSNAGTDEARASVIAAFAAEFGKNVASVRQKLVREDVYVKKAYVNKNGEKPESKEVLVARIAGALEVDFEVAESLVKANKKILETLAEHFAD